MTGLTAYFVDVKTFAKFNAKPHLFSYSEPQQMGGGGANDGVFVNFTGGKRDQFKSRVEQFDGVVINV